MPYSTVSCVISIAFAISHRRDLFPELPRLGRRSALKQLPICSDLYIDLLIMCLVTSMVFDPVPIVRGQPLHLWLFVVHDSMLVLPNSACEFPCSRYSFATHPCILQGNGCNQNKFLSGDFQGDQNESTSTSRSKVHPQHTQPHHEHTFQPHLPHHHHRPTRPTIDSSHSFAPTAMLKFVQSWPSWSYLLPSSSGPAIRYPPPCPSDLPAALTRRRSHCASGPL